MNFKYVWIVLKKELKDIIRDKKTILSNILIPIILMPVLFSVMGGGIKKLEKDMSENITVAVSEKSNDENVKKILQDEIFAQNQNIVLQGVVKDPVEAVRNGEVRFVVEVEPDFEQKLKQGKPFEINFIYNHSDTKANGSFQILMQAVEQYKQKVIMQRLQAQGIDPEILQPVVVKQTNAADEKKSGNMMLMMILPLLVAIIIASGGIPAATDLVAGERERGTFEPLLTTRPDRMSILLGKYFAVTLFSFVGLISQFAGMFIAVKMNPQIMGFGASGEMGGIYIPLPALLLSILILAALGMVFAGIQFALSTYAKSFKEAQTYMSFLIFAAMVPAYATMMMQPEDFQTFMFAIPLLNAIASFKTILGNVINYTNLFIALASSVGYVIISLIFSASLFNKEKVLFRS